MYFHFTLAKAVIQSHRSKLFDTVLPAGVDACKGAVTKLSGNGKITREIKNRTLILFFDILCLLRGIVIFKWRLSIYTL